VLGFGVNVRSVTYPPDVAGRATSLEQTAYEIGRRDQLDAERKISPLVAAPDAVEIDSTHLTADRVVERILELVRERKLTQV